MKERIKSLEIFQHMASTYMLKNKKIYSICAYNYTEETTAKSCYLFKKGNKTIIYLTKLEINVYDLQNYLIDRLSGKRALHFIKYNDPFELEKNWEEYKKEHKYKYIIYI